MGKLNLTKALKNALPYVLTLILVGIMTFVAEILGEWEIIFPEITALAIGYMVTQRQGWKVNDSRMIALIAICAVAVVLFRRFLLKVKIRDKEDFQSVNLHAKSDVIDTAVRTICVAVVGFFAIWSGFKFAIAPPLLVAFTEFSRPKNKARNKPVKTVLLITVCAFVGAVSRYVLNMTLGLPLTVAALTATAIMLVIVYCTKIYIPPAGALTILSMIIPSESVLLYPLQILVGTAVIMLISRLLFMKRQN